MKKGFLIVLSIIWTASAFAEEAKWDSTAAFGLNLTQGNSNTFLGNITLLSERKSLTYEVRLGAEASYGENEVEKSDGEKAQETNVQNTRVYGDYKWLLEQRYYTYFNTDIKTDEIADIQYRLNTGPGAGRFFVKNETTVFSGEAGVSYVRQKLGGIESDLAALRLSERFEYNISSTSKVWQWLEYLPAVDDFSRYLINAETGIEAAVNSSLSLRLVLQNNYNSDPAPDKESNDLTVIASIGYKF